MSYPGLIAETVAFQGYNGDKGEAYYARPSGSRIVLASRAMLVRQSTSVPNTSKKQALGVCMMLFSRRP